MAAAVLGLGLIIGCICGLVIPSAAADDVFIITSAQKIGEIELGEYPQTFVGKTRNDTYIKDPLTATGKKYTTYIESEKVELVEYLLPNKKKVVKVPSAKWTTGIHGVANSPVSFSDNTVIENGKTYFFDVEPIKFDLFKVNDKLVAVGKHALGSMAVGSVNWAESAVRTFLQNNFNVNAQLSSYAAAITHYATMGTDDRAGSLVSDSIWLPSVREMNTLYTNVKLEVRECTDLGRATATEDRGPYGLEVNNDTGAICLLRSSTPDGNGGSLIDGAGNAYATSLVNNSCPWFAYFPAFVLNDSTAQYKTKVTAATCQATGYTESWWEVNGKQIGEKQKYNETPVADHIWGEWETVTEHTCVTAGERRHTCTVCGYTETEHVPANNDKHSYVEKEKVPATCGHEGYTVYECERENCTASYREVTAPKLQHEWGEWETTKEATATQNGTAERQCAVCGATEQKTLPATSPLTGTTDNGNNSGTVWLIFGIIAGGVLVLGGGAVSWLFIAGIQRKKKEAKA